MKKAEAEDEEEFKKNAMTEPSIEQKERMSPGGKPPEKLSDNIKRITSEISKF